MAVPDNGVGRDRRIALKVVGGPTQSWGAPLGDVASRPSVNAAYTRVKGNRTQQRSDDLPWLGHHPLHGPLGILLDEDDDGKARHTSPRIRCERFDGCHEHLLPHSLYRGKQIRIGGTARMR